MKEEEVWDNMKDGRMIVAGKIKWTSEQLDADKGKGQPIGSSRCGSRKTAVLVSE